jgi:hypothetical protein
VRDRGAEVAANVRRSGSGFIPVGNGRVHAEMGGSHSSCLTRGTACSGVYVKRAPSDRHVQFTWQKCSEMVGECLVYTRYIRNVRGYS